MTKAELIDIKETIEWLLENGNFKDLETSYNSAMNSLNTLDEAINYARCCKSDSELLNTTEKRNIFNEGYSLGFKTGKRQLDNGV